MSAGELAEGCLLRPFLLFITQATSPLRTCSLPPSPPTSHTHTYTRSNIISQQSRSFSCHLFLFPLYVNKASMSDNTENGTAPATPKAGGAGGGYSSLTPREQEILAKAMTCLKTAPEVSICTSIQLRHSQ